MTHVVVNLIIGLLIAVQGRIDQQHEDYQHDGESLDDALGKAVGVPDQGTMAGLLQRTVQQQDQRGQQGNAAQHAQQHALGHDQTQILAQREAHEAQGGKARNGGRRAAHHGGQRCADGVGHGLVGIGDLFPLLVVAVPQEDGVVHRDGQLQHGGHSLGDVGDLTHHHIAAQIIDDADADGEQEHQRGQPAVQKEHHGGAGQQHGQTDVHGLFLLAQVLQVGDQRRHAGDETLLPRQRTNLPDGVHGHIRRGGGIEEHGHQRGVLRVELLIEAVRQKLHGQAQIGQAVVPDHAVHMFHGGDFFLQRRHVLRGHILHNHQRKRALAEVVQQFVLADDGIHVLGQIVQHIIIDAGVGHPEHRRHQQHQRYDQNGHAVLDDRFGETHEADPSFLFGSCLGSTAPFGSSANGLFPLSHCLIGAALLLNAAGHTSSHRRGESGR